MPSKRRPCSTSGAFIDIRSLIWGLPHTDLGVSAGSGNTTRDGRGTWAPGLNTDSTRRRAYSWTGAVYSAEMTTPCGGLVSVSLSRAINHLGGPRTRQRNHAEAAQIAHDAMKME